MTTDLEHGCYWTKAHPDAPWWLGHYGPDGWSFGENALCGMPTPAVIGERMYRPDDWRPARHCSPPLDGTVFEVRDLDDVRVRYEESRDAWFFDDRLGAAFAWIFRQHWRPLA